MSNMYVPIRAEVEVYFIGDKAPSWFFGNVLSESDIVNVTERFNAGDVRGPLIIIETLNGHKFKARRGDAVILDKNGEVTVCSRAVFDQKYEPVVEEGEPS